MRKSRKLTKLVKITLKNVWKYSFLKLKNKTQKSNKPTTKIVYQH